MCRSLQYRAKVLEEDVQETNNTEAHVTILINVKTKKLRKRTCRIRGHLCLRALIVGIILENKKRECHTCCPFYVWRLWYAHLS